MLTIERGGALETVLCALVVTKICQHPTERLQALRCRQMGAPQPILADRQRLRQAYPRTPQITKRRQRDTKVMQTLGDCRIARSQGRFTDCQRFLEVKPRGGIALLLEPERAETGVRLRGCGVDAERFGLTPQRSLQAYLDC